MTVLRRFCLRLRACARGRMSAPSTFACAFAFAVALAVFAGAGIPRAAATGASCSSTGFALTPLHGTRFYVDSSSSPVLNSGYTGVSITPAAAKTNIWVQLSGFSGGALGLNANQPSAFPLGNLASGSSTPAYFFLTANPVADTTTAQSFSVDVYQGDPAHGGSLLCSYADGYSAGVYDTIQASANKVQDVTGDSVSSSISTTSPVIGGAITLTVEGTTGTLGSGPDGVPFIYETPTSLGTWPAGSFRLVGTTLTLAPGASQTVYSNQLQISNSAFSAAKDYIAQYTFQITGTTSAATTPYPIQEISSGTQVKHTNTSSLSSIPAIQPASNTMSLSQTASASTLPSTGGTVTYTVQLHSTSAIQTSVDEIVDTLPAGTTYQAGTAKLDGASIADPTITAGTLVFPGPFSLSSAADRSLTFDVTVPGAAGTYTNAAVGYVASTLIDTTTSTSDSTPATANTTVAGAPQTITFAQPADTRADQGPVALSASASSGLGVSFSSSTSGVCTTSGASVALLSAGTCTITASQPGNATFAAAIPVTKSFLVTAAQLAQTITFPQPSDTRLDGGPVALTATASSGLAVSYASTTAGVCSVSGSNVTLLAVGTCTISASQAGSAGYAAAPGVSRSFGVTAVPVAPTAQSIAFPGPADTRIDRGPVSLTATATSGLAVDYASSTTSVCTVTGSSVSLVSVGTCTITAAQAGDATYAAAAPVAKSFQVSAVPAVTPSAQTISFAQPADTRVDGGPVALAASATSGLGVSFASTTTSVCAVSSSSVTLLAVGTCTIVASQAGNATYAAAADVSQSFQVTAVPASPASPTAQAITFPQPSDTRADQGPVSLGATASSGLPVAYASATTGICAVAGSSVTLLATGTCTIAASQGGDSTYAAAADVTVSFAVTAVPAPATPAAQSIAFPQPADTALGQGPVSLAASASSGLTVTYASSTTGVCTTSGAAVTLVSAGTCTIVASQAGDGRYAAAPDVSRSFVVAIATSPISAPPATPASQAITFAQPSDVAVDQGPLALGATASSGLAVSYTSATPSVCTVSGSSVALAAVGTCAITASQGGDSAYTAAADVSRSFAVTSAGTAPPSPPPAPAPPAAPAPAPPAAPAPASSNTPAPQEIVFAPLPAVGLGSGPIDLAAVASSGLAVSYESATPSICTVAPGGAVTVLATGTCTIVAGQPGDDRWTSAAAARQSFAVVAAPLLTPTTAPATTTAGKTTQSLLGGIPSGAAVTLAGTQKLPGVAAAHVVGNTVVVTPTASFSGIVRVPVVVTKDGRTIETTVAVTVRPAAPTKIAVRPRTKTSTQIAWTPSPSATGYVVRVDGRVVCRVTAAVCNVAALVAPNQRVVVTSTGNSGTSSDEARAAYRPDHPVLIAIVHFASDSPQLRAAARRILNHADAKIERGGFTHAMLTCHTDSAGSLVYNMALSAARCASVAGYVHRVLGVAHVSYRQASFAFLRPAAPNSSAHGMAENRRVEVYVR